MSSQARGGLWGQVFVLHGSITPHVLLDVIVFGLIATAVCIAARVLAYLFQVQIGLDVALYEIAGAALSLLLVLRTNAGHERWWEGRKLWGGIVNQCRNLAIGALCYGPQDANWRNRFIRCVAVFPHIARSSLRGEQPSPEVADLIGSEAAGELANAEHMPSGVARMLGDLLQEACAGSHMDGFAFLQIDRERALLIDHVGGCERILKTPLPLVFAIKVRQFIVLFLLTLPFALLHQLSNDWLIPFVTMLTAYPLIALDQIGVELQNPFSATNVSHLPLDDICATIQRNLVGLLRAQDPPADSPAPCPPLS
jgi:putative membrane protein